MVSEAYINELKKAMAARSVKALIDKFNSQVGRTRFNSTQDIHNNILIDTLADKGIDVSVVYHEGSISFARRIKLSDDNTTLIFA